MYGEGAQLDEAIGPADDDTSRTVSGIELLTEAPNGGVSEALTIIKKESGDDDGSVVLEASIATLSGTGPWVRLWQYRGADGEVQHRRIYLHAGVRYRFRTTSAGTTWRVQMTG